MAVSTLINKQVARIVLTHPAVGEAPGHLPAAAGRSIASAPYDALFDMLDRARQLLERNVISRAHRAMRGRTLNDGFIIDEGRTHARQ